MQKFDTLRYCRDGVKLIPCAIRKGHLENGKIIKDLNTTKYITEKKMYMSN